ncbi:hypothetical protein GQ457_06G009470 [Hibiscus cannabinus]
MIICLLGKSIGYRALWNMILSLWNPIGDISLIDSDNEYYMVRFADEEDFHKVLSGGSWVIYGSYLTVHPWSRHFNFAEDHPSHIMVWVCLPKLPYRYYTKSLFRYIAASIGKDIEYEGLPNICFKCGKYGHAKEYCGVVEAPAITEENAHALRNPEDLYGPWMQVVNRRRRNVNISGSSGGNEGSTVAREARGSRFAALATEITNVVEGEVGPQLVGEEYGTRTTYLTEQRAHVVGVAGASTSAGKLVVPQHKQQAIRGKVTGGVVLTEKVSEVAGQVSPVAKVGIREALNGGNINVATHETIVQVPSSLNVEKHAAVRVGGGEAERSQRSIKGRVLPASLKMTISIPGSKVGVITSRAKPEPGQARLGSKTVLIWLCSRFVELEIFRLGLGSEIILFGSARARSSLSSARAQQARLSSKEATICNIWDDLKECIKWDIRNVRNTDFWYDHWLGKDSRLAFSCSLYDAPRPLRVVDMVNEHGMWDWDRLEPMLPKEKLERIASIHHPRDDFGDDKTTWRWENMQSFSTRSAYNFLNQTLDPYDSSIWRRIWHFAVPQRVWVFLWLTFHERLLTNVERVRCHLSTSKICGICGGGRESVDHVLRLCAAAKGLWLRVLPPDRHGDFFSLTFQEWLHQNLFGVTFMDDDEKWHIRFLILCWLLWKRRCSLLLDSTVGVLGDVLLHGIRLVTECSRAMCESWDLLAKRGRCLHMESMVYASPPGEIVKVIEDETRERPTPGAFSSWLELVEPFDPGGVA